jgi:hypothetical protein
MSAKAYVDIPALELMDVELPGVVGGGMSDSMVATRQFHRSAGLLTHRWHQSALSKTHSDRAPDAQAEAT